MIKFIIIYFVLIAGIINCLVEDVEAFTERSSFNEISSGNDWDLKFTETGKVLNDVYFVNTEVGYIVSELGAVYRTSNCGANWETKLDLGFPYYWEGVFALNPDTLVISGFNDGNRTQGLVRWSFNGGTNWTPDIILSSPLSGWLNKIHFFNKDTGVVISENPSAFYTTNGGKDIAS